MFSYIRTVVSGGVVVVRNKQAGGGVDCFFALWRPYRAFEVLFKNGVMIMTK